VADGDRAYNAETPARHHHGRRAVSPSRSARSSAIRLRSLSSAPFNRRPASRALASGDHHTKRVQVRAALSQMRLTGLSVGKDGRNRTLLSTFRARTGRNQPSNSKFIFGPSVWLRSLIRPEPGTALA
jgi:hypothetical protein